MQPHRARRGRLGPARPQCAGRGARGRSRPQIVPWHRVRQARPRTSNTSAPESAPSLTVACGSAATAGALGVRARGGAGGRGRRSRARDPAAHVSGGREGQRQGRHGHGSAGRHLLHRGLEAGGLGGLRHGGLGHGRTEGHGCWWRVLVRCWVVLAGCGKWGHGPMRPALCARASARSMPGAGPAGDPPPPGRGPGGSGHGLWWGARGPRAPGRRGDRLHARGPAPNGGWGWGAGRPPRGMRRWVAGLIDGGRPAGGEGLARGRGRGGGRHGRGAMDARRTGTGRPAPPRAAPGAAAAAAGALALPVHGVLQACRAGLCCYYIRGKRGHHIRRVCTGFGGASRGQEWRRGYADRGGSRRVNTGPRRGAVLPGHPALAPSRRPRRPGDYGAPAAAAGRGAGGLVARPIIFPTRAACFDSTRGPPAPARGGAGWRRAPPYRCGARPSPFAHARPPRPRPPWPRPCRPRGARHRSIRPPSCAFRGAADPRPPPPTPIGGRPAGM
jgi:hypothetical protein